MDDTTDELAKQLQQRLGPLSPEERSTFRKRLSGTRRITSGTRRLDVLARIEADIDAAISRRKRLQKLMSGGIRYPGDLPVSERRHEILDVIRDNQVVIIAGETGSGKSTQLPKLCLELGRGVDRMIGHTQPRRIAARSIAERVAEELGTEVGGLVGYTVRFTDEVGDDTMVKVMTDGILLAEIQRDRMLRRYDTIILDEAHERTLNIDFLIGYLKTLLPQRPDLKLIVTSATIDTERFAAHFGTDAGPAPVVEVTGRMYPVEVRYRPLDPADRTTGGNDPSGHGSARDQVEAICDAVSELFRIDPGGGGDVLVFCSGEREIRDAADALEELQLRHTEVLQLYARLSAAQQHRVFSPHTGRRIVVATNVAETSLTVPGIRYVVDAGTARVSRFSRRTKVQRLPIEPISQASANQRSGRCGRLGPGVCIRLYSEDDFESRPYFTEPEILRTNLASVILQMAALGLGDVASFPFLDPPDRRTVTDGVNLLHELGAVDPDREGTRGWLTSMGERLAKLPLDPRYARMVEEASGRGCLAEVLVIAAALSIRDPRERPEGKEQQAAQMHARFRVETSDLMGMVSLWAYLRKQRKQLTSGQFRRMCGKEYLNHRRVREWQDIHAQLRDVTRELGMKRNRSPAAPETVHLAVLSGLLSHIGRKDPDGYEYRGARGARFSLSPGSVLFKKAPEWVMAADLVETSRLWARGVVAIDPEWIERLGTHLIRRSHGEPWWNVEQGAALCSETSTIFGIPIATDRTVQYARVEPAAAREMFISHVLVDDEWPPESEGRHHFAIRNRERIAEVIDQETRERRTDLLATGNTLGSWFDERLPADVTTVRAFERWWRGVREATPGLLDVPLDVLVDPDVRRPDVEAFPQVWHHGDVVMPIEYEFDPASATDGVTIEVPLAGLDRIDPVMFEWNVPGRRAELIEALIRSLPKGIRTRFLPIADTVDALVGKLSPDSGAPVEAVRRALAARANIAIAPDAFDIDRVPPHLRPRFRIIGTAGEVVAEGPDLAELKSHLVEETRATLGGTTHPLERTGITDWDFGDLPLEVEVGGAGSAAGGEPGRSVTVYPALVDEGDSVSMRLMATPEEQAEETWNGVRRLVLLALPSPRRVFEPLLDAAARVAIRNGPHESPSEWIEDCLGCAMGAVLNDVGAIPTTRAGFDALLATTRTELFEWAAEIGNASLDILETLQRIERLFDGITVAGVFEDVAAQVSSLIYPGFVTGVGAGRLLDVDRYLRAVEYRLGRLPADVVRDAERMAVVHALEEEYDRLAELLPTTTEVVECGWMLQELRVSLFAQQLGTRIKISPKRMRSALDGLVR